MLLELLGRRIGVKSTELHMACFNLDIFTFDRFESRSC
jgi:hypothetical protein